MVGTREKLITGWLVDRGAPDRKAQVQIFVNGQSVGYAKADRYDENVHAKHGGDGHYGFAFYYNGRIEAAADEASAVAAETGTPLRSKRPPLLAPSKRTGLPLTIDRLSVGTKSRILGRIGAYPGKQFHLEVWRGSDRCQSEIPVEFAKAGGTFIAEIPPSLLHHLGSADAEIALPGLKEAGLAVSLREFLLATVAWRNGIIRIKLSDRLHIADGATVTLRVTESGATSELPAVFSSNVWTVRAPPGFDPSQDGFQIRVGDLVLPMLVEQHLLRDLQFFDIGEAGSPWRLSNEAEARCELHDFPNELAHRWNLSGHIAHVTSTSAGGILRISQTVMEQPAKRAGTTLVVRATKGATVIARLTDSSGTLCEDSAAVEGEAGWHVLTLKLPQECEVRGELTLEVEACDQNVSELEVAVAGSGERFDPLDQVRLFLLSPENFQQSSGRFRSTAERLAAIDRFINQAAHDTPSPAPWFDAEFYRRSRGDREAVHDNPYLDFVMSGRFRGFHPSAAHLDRDIKAILNAAPEGTTRYAAHVPDIQDPYELARHFLQVGFHKEFDWIPGFDREFVESIYPEYVETSVNSAVFASLHFKKCWFFSNLDEALPEITLLWESDLFDEEFYRLQLARDKLTQNARLHYLAQGARASLDPGPRFSTAYYMERYPDLDVSQTNPLTHYILWGRVEGRKGTADPVKRIDGEREWDPAKPTILIASHDGNRTGAPIVALRLAQTLTEHYNVFIWLGRTGDLEDDFSQNSVGILVGFPDVASSRAAVRKLLQEVRLSFVVLNSVESYPLLEGFADEKVGVVSLIHEFADYTRPPGKLSRMVAYSQKVIMPAQIVRESCDREFARHLLPPTTNIVIRAQGGDTIPTKKLIDPAARDRLRSKILGSDAELVVFGAGYVQIRKGVDWFIDIARRVVLDHGVKAKFVWVGTNYNPDMDITYGIWLREQIRRMRVEDHVIMVPEQKNLDDFWAISDLFLLPSRLDPFPNVALDAIANQKPVVCFQDATGIAELADNPDLRITAVRYGDTVEASAAVVELLRKGVSDPTGTTDSARAQISDLLSFKRYAEDVEQCGKEAMQIIESFPCNIDELVRMGAFDPAFFASGLPPWLRMSWLWREWEVPSSVAALRYHKLTSSGIYAAKARPGFNDAVVSMKAGGGGQHHGVLTSGVSLNTHDVIHVDEARSGSSQQSKLSTLVHLHLYNADLAEGFAARLFRSGLKADVVITTDTAAKCLKIEKEFGGVGESQTIEVVKNRGRDIGPFLHVLQKYGRRYDLIAHFHGKSSAALSKATVDAWSAFVLDHLLPPAPITNTMLDLFSAEPGLGMIFAEDPTIVGWTKNRPYAEELAKRLRLTVPVPDQPEFPIGTMFWARTAALEPLTKSELNASDLPPEPIPYDGTMLHALERMLPVICQSAGYRWQTVTRKGVTRHA